MLSQIEMGNIASPKGFKAIGIHCGIRKMKKDLAVLLSAVPAVSAAVFTTNIFQAAPLQVMKDTLANSYMQRALIVNSGNANSFTGEQGLEDAYMMRSAVAKQLNIAEAEVFVASTGVIGERMPMEAVSNGIASLPMNFADGGGMDFGEAIITTDTVVKSLAIELEIDNKKVVIGGVAKGSGMIHPNMATMLAFITTDANISKAALKGALSKITDQTFNMITVDGDTSTNDMVLVMANGLAGNEGLDESHPDWPVFYQGLSFVAEQLAKMIAKDGEGATKLITVKVEGASTQEMASAVAKKIIGSNLVKTAVFGADGNWGRVVMAIGNSGFPLEEKSLEISIGSINVVKQGKPAVYLEEAVTLALQESEVLIQVNLHLGKETATAWGCDLSYDYVKINASYRT